MGINEVRIQGQEVVLVGVLDYPIEVSPKDIDNVV